MGLVSSQIENMKTFPLARIITIYIDVGYNQTILIGIFFYLTKLDKRCWSGL